MRGVVCVLFCAVYFGAPARAAADGARGKVLAIVAQIQRADYEGDRPALARLYDELTPFVEDKEVASRVRYWRGFALWRRALNGFNESADPKDLGKDLKQAMDEFEAAIAKDPGFADAKVGTISCLSNILFLDHSDPVRTQEQLAKGKALAQEAKAAAPENPRLLWVLGANLWYTPPEHGGGQAKAMETYEKGLEFARKQRGRVTDPLEPSWGEPELMMNLAWANMHKAQPDLGASEKYARSALEIVPYWHYVRDILLPQIQQAKEKAVSGAPQRN